MSADPLSCLTLTSGEQVLWHGRPGVRLSRRGRQQVTSTWGSVVLIAMLYGTSPVHAAWATLVPVALVLATGAAAAVALSHLVGGCQVSIGYLFLVGPLLAILWAGCVIQRGAAGALDLLSQPEVLILLVLLGLAVARIAQAILVQLHTHYYVTSNQVAEVRVSSRAPRLRWRAPLPRGWLELRVIKPLGGRGRGHIALGTGPRRKLLRWLSNPDETLEDIKRSVGEDAFAKGPPRKAGQAAPPDQASPAGSGTPGGAPSLAVSGEA